MADRKRQIATAQNEYRRRRRKEGFARLQAWLPGEAMQSLQELCQTLDLGQSETLVVAIANLRKSLQTQIHEV
jgi:hypothetical protein